LATFEKKRNEKANEKFEMKLESEACKVCNWKWQGKLAEEQYLEKQEDKSGYCYIDLWNEDTEAGKEEVETKECEDNESGVSNNKENVNREENDDTESF